jgi:hypothetical protein|nr:MAG TPA: deoxynucleoside monophosphate kinase [Caudoviricetes sp.]
MNKKLIVLSGKKRVGKDTVANLFNDYTNRKYALRAFAEPVKEIVSQAVGTDSYTLDLYKESLLVAVNGIDSNLTIRELYRKTADFYKELLGEDIFAKLMLKRLAYENYEFPRVIITDMRFKAEYEQMKLLDPVFIRVKCRMGNRDTHPSEIDLDDVPDSDFHFIIDNTGTRTQLKEQVQTIVKKLRI